MIISFWNEKGFSNWYNAEKNANIPKFFIIMFVFYYYHAESLSKINRRSLNTLPPTIYLGSTISPDC